MRLLFGGCGTPQAPPPGENARLFLKLALRLSREHVLANRPVCQSTRKWREICRTGQDGKRCIVPLLDCSSMSFKAWLKPARSACRKRPLSSLFSILPCVLSRACLGKWSPFHRKMAPIYLSAPMFSTPPPATSPCFHMNPVVVVPSPSCQTIIFQKQKWRTKCEFNAVRTRGVSQQVA